MTEAIGVPAGRVLLLDDLAENVIGARAAGLQAKLIKTHADTAAAVAAALGNRISRQ